MADGARKKSRSAIAAATWGETAWAARRAGALSRNAGFRSVGFDRLGMEDQHVNILGVNIPHIIIPVRPGRDLARLVEVAAFQTKLKLSGYNPAKELNERLLAQMAPGHKD